MPRSSTEHCTEQGTEHCTVRKTVRYTVRNAVLYGTLHGTLYGTLYGKLRLDDSITVVVCCSINRVFLILDIRISKMVTNQETMNNVINNLLLLNLPI